MKQLRPAKLFQSVLVLMLLAWPVRSQPFADWVGLTALQAATTNLNGTGVRVAVIEAPYGATGNFEADPSLVGQPVSLFTYFSAAGSATNYPNSVGGFSGHADDSVNTVCSPIHSGFGTNIAHLDNIEANYFYQDCVTILAGPAFNDPVANQSYTFGPLTVASQQLHDLQYDNYSLANNMLFVSAVGDGGPVAAPGTSYDCIGVAAYYPSGASSSIGPTIDNGRCKPDITAINVQTSGSTPEVAGAVVLLLHAGRRGDGGSATNAAADMRTLKALLLNGAVKPPGWTNGATTPLDARHGAGVLNVLNSYFQLTGGKHDSIVSSLVTLGGAHPPPGATGTVSVLSGWNFTTNTSSVTSDSIHHYYFNVSNANVTAKFTATATLVWFRQTGMSSINNLNLFLYNTANSNLVSSSISAVDNVEHIYVTNLAQGRYDLQVWKAGGAGTVSASEPYALAWEFVPPPVLAVSGGTNYTLNWPLYPQGFLVEARTNLIAGAWSTNGFPFPAVTNGANSIPLNTTNGAQFFRLRKPNL